MSLPAPASDRTALVTGASSGIGAEIARQLARRGHGVTLVARSRAKLEALAAELAADGVRAEVVSCDLTDRASRAALPGKLEALGLSVDILVNNAGSSTLGPVAASDPEAEIAMIELDVVAVADLCSRFLPGMVERRRGAVLNVASGRRPASRSRTPRTRCRRSCGSRLPRWPAPGWTASTGVVSS